MYRFGDVVAWETARGRYARWMILIYKDGVGDGRQYQAVWIGDAPAPVGIYGPGDLGDVGVDGGHDDGSPYLVSKNE
jgi:hypothetical protein